MIAKGSLLARTLRTSTITTAFTFTSPTLPLMLKLAKHTQSIVFFVEDESKTDNLFARKRVSLQCDSQKIERGSDRFEEVLGLFAAKFDAKMVGTLKKMLDFNLYEFKVTYGEATFGFGKPILWAESIWINWLLEQR